MTLYWSAVVVVSSFMFSVVGVVAGTPTVAVVGPFLSVVIVRERQRRIRASLRRRRGALLPVLVDELVQAVRSGRSLRSSCETLDEPMRVAGRSELLDRRALVGPVVATLRDRGSLVDAATALSSSGEPAARLLAVTLRTLAVNGGPALPALRRLRHTLMGQVHAEHQAASASAQATASAAAMALAPMVFGLLAASVDGRVAELYLSDPVGLGCVSVTCALSYTGWCWMNRIVQVGMGHGPECSGESAEATPSASVGSASTPPQPPVRTRRNVVITITVIVTVVFLATLFVIASVVVSPAIGIAIGALGLGSAAAKRRQGTIRRESRQAAALVPVIELVAVVVGAGGTVADAVNTVATDGPPPVRQAFLAVVRRSRSGLVLSDALAPASAELGSVFHPLIGALVSAELDGAPLGSLLTRLEEDADQVRRRDTEARAARLSVTLVWPLVVCLLPAVVIGAVVPVTVVAVRHIGL